MARFIPRLYIDLDISANTEIILSAAQSHYLCNVMRKKAGDNILLFNAKGEWRGQMIVASKSACQFAVIEQTKLPVFNKRLALYFSPVKQHNEFIIQKATELGVDDIYPIAFDHTLIAKLNMEKLNKIAIDAAEQSERLTVPNIHEIIKFSDLLRSINELVFVCSEKLDNPHIIDLLSSKSDFYAVMVGPEGGFSEHEFKLMSDSKMLSFATLSNNILRSDTAVITALACCQSAVFCNSISRKIAR